MQTVKTIFSTKVSLALSAFRLVNEIESKIAGQGEKNMIAYTIQLAIKRNQPLLDIIETIHDQAIDNYNAIADLIGIKLTDQVLNFGK